MSDVTETVLERSLPAYQDLVQRRLFTAEEVRALVEARRGFEYKLQRRAARKADYQRYIDHELKVESLRKLRRRRLGLQKRTLSDFSQTQHVFFIYDRGVRKFPADLDFWLQYLDFAQDNVDVLRGARAPGGGVFCIGVPATADSLHAGARGLGSVHGGR